MAAFLLIHGSCHGAWCWREVIPALEALGHQARAIDLPAHGADPTPAAEATLAGYADAILAAIDGLASSATLVGHSAAGFPITLAAELAPERIARLVYLCAYVPAPGRSLIDLRRAGPRQPLKGVLAADPGGITYSADPAGARAAFYHDCPEEAVAFALPRLCPEPILPQATPLPAPLPAPLHGPLHGPLVGPGVWPLVGPWVGPAVERHYLLCTDDRTIPPEYQAAMAAPFAPGHVARLPSGHSPFFSMPGRLAALLDRVASGALPFPAAPR